MANGWKPTCSLRYRIGSTCSPYPACCGQSFLFVQTFGDLVNFNPHIHVLAADGVFDADGGFTVLPPIPRKVLEPWFRAEVLALLRREGLVSEAFAEKMLAWRHTGFSAHNSVRVRARDAAGRREQPRACAPPGRA